MHTHNIRIMISAIYAEDREDMENISMSMKRYYKTGRKNIAYVYASLVVGFMNYFPSYLVLKIKIEFALYDDDRIAEINFYSELQSLPILPMITDAHILLPFTFILFL